MSDVAVAVAVFVLQLNISSVLYCRNSKTSWTWLRPFVVVCGTMSVELGGLNSNSKSTIYKAQ